MEDLIEAYLSVYEDSYLDEGFKRMNRDKIERQAKKLGGDRGDVLRIVADKMDTEAERKYSTSQARKNRAGAGSEYRKAQELRARDDAKADFEKYGLPESADLYDVVLDHLLDEGYADTEENAITIMANMSEEWIDEIIDEAYVDWRKGKLPSGRTPRQAAQSSADSGPAKARIKAREKGEDPDKADIPAYEKRRKINRVTREMDAHTSVGGKINKLLSPGLGNRSGASPRMAHGEPNTQRHQRAIINRGGRSTYAE